MSQIVRLGISGVDYRTATNGSAVAGTFEDFLRVLLAVESGIDPARFSWYVAHYDVPMLAYPRVSEPGRVVRDYETGQLCVERVTIREYFKSIGVDHLFTPDDSSCIPAMQYASKNALGFVGYQLGEEALIATGYYLPERVLTAAVQPSERPRHFVGGLPASTWARGRRMSLERSPQYGVVLATDVNEWTGAFTGRRGVVSIAQLGACYAQELIVRDLFDHNFAMLTKRVDISRFLNRSIAELDRPTGADRIDSLVIITLSGLLAACFLCGYQRVEEFLLRGATSADEFGTAIEDYLQVFSGYDAPYPMQ
jgi:hypothetical protein